MKHNYKELLDNNLSVNSYLWPNDRNPFEFIETVVKSRIKNIGLHTDFINNFGVNKLTQELTLNKINVTSIMSNFETVMSSKGTKVVIGGIYGCSSSGLHARWGSGM